MSEKKNVGKSKKTVTPKRGGGFGINAIIAIVIAVVLGLGIYAVASTYIANHPKEEQAPTVADFIKDNDLSFDEFKTEYGLTEAEISEDDAIETVSMSMTLENYAKYADMTLDELKTKYQLGDDVAADITWQEAVNFMPTGVVAENFFETDFDTFKTQMGLTDEITADTLWSETNEIMNEVYSQENAESEEAEENSEADIALESDASEENEQ